VSTGWRRRAVGRTRDAGWEIGVSKTHDTTLQLAVRSAGAGRAMLVIHQERLADAAERERQRRHWQGVINALVEALTEG
jgi:hypothetical protein